MADESASSGPVISQTPSLYTLVATILRPQGRHGEVLCDLLTDFPEKFEERRRLFLLRGADASSARETSLEEFWMPQGKNAGRIVLKLAGTDSIDDAEKLAGLDVAIPFQERAPLDEGEFFAADLLGCEVFDRDALIGAVEDVDLVTTSTPLLVVRGASSGEILVPLAKAYLKHADIAARKIVMELPEGLVEINKPGPKENTSGLKPRKVSDALRHG